MVKFSTDVEQPYRANQFNGAETIWFWKMSILLYNGRENSQFISENVIVNAKCANDKSVQKSQRYIAFTKGELGLKHPNKW